MTRFLAVIATAFLLIGVAACAVEEEHPDDRSYYDVDILKDKVTEAGYDCKSWGESAGGGVSLGGGGYEQIDCSNGDYVVWFQDSKSVKSFAEITSTDTMLAGQNWVFVSDKAGRYQEALGGKLLKP